MEDLIEEQTFDAAYISDLRGECRKYRLALREEERRALLLKDRLAALEAGNNPELEALRAEVEELERALAEREASENQSKIATVAKELGYHDPQDAVKLLGDTAPTRQALMSLANKYPELVSRPLAPSPGTPGVRRPMSRKLTPNEMFAAAMRNSVRGGRGR